MRLASDPRGSAVGILCALAIGLASGAQAQAPPPPAPPRSASAALAPGPEPTGAEARPDLAQLEADARAKPNDPERQAQYGLALVRSGNVDEGLATLARASGMAPDEPTVMLLYAKGLAAAKRDAEAADVALRAARSPLAPNRLAAEAYFMAGSIRWKQRSNAEAEDYLRRAVKLDPKNGGAQFNLGLFLYNDGKTPEGLLIMQQAAETSLDNARVQMRVARIMELLGRTDSAIVYWSRVVALVPDDGEIRLVLGNLLVAAGRPEEAAVQFKRAVEIRDSDVDARLAYCDTLLRLKLYDEALAQAEAAKRLGAGAPADALIERVQFMRKQ